MIVSFNLTENMHRFRVRGILTTLGIGIETTSVETLKDGSVIFIGRKNAFAV